MPAGESYTVLSLTERRQCCQFSLITTDETSEHVTEPEVVGAVPRFSGDICIEITGGPTFPAACAPTPHASSHLLSLALSFHLRLHYGRRRSGYGGSVAYAVVYVHESSTR